MIRATFVAFIATLSIAAIAVASAVGVAALMYRELHTVDFDVF